MSDDDNVEDLYLDFHDNPMYWAEKYTELRTAAQAFLDCPSGVNIDALAAYLKGD